MSRPQASAVILPGTAVIRISWVGTEAKLTVCAQGRSPAYRTDPALRLKAPSGRRPDTCGGRKINGG